MEEKYLISIVHKLTFYSFYTIVPNRKELIQTLNLLGDDFIVTELKPMFSFVSYEEFSQELKSRQQPDDLNFG